jgi:hypothetical protein
MKHARRFRDIVKNIQSTALIIDAPSEEQRMFVRNAATLSLMREKLKMKMDAGKSIDLKLYNDIGDRLDYAARCLGLKRGVPS